MKPLTTARAIRNGLAMLAIVIGAGVGACLLPQHHKPIGPATTEIVVQCPSEDSCGYPSFPDGWSADYRDGAWHLTKLRSWR